MSKEIILPCTWYSLVSMFYRPLSCYQLRNGCHTCSQSLYTYKKLVAVGRAPVIVAASNYELC